MSSEEEYSDSEDCLRRTILPVAKFTDYDKSVPPRSGEEYLRRVQLEEKEYPEILVKNITIKQQQNNKSIKLELMNKDFFYLNDDRVPKSEWIDDVVAEFSELRLKIMKIRNMNADHFEARYRNYANLDVIWWKDTFENERNKPFVRLALEYPQEHVKNGIRFITRYLKESKKFSTFQGEWIYSLLACLELPLPAEFYYNLRSLSCVCSYIRNKYTVDQTEEIRSINIIIYLIGKYFNQYDLIDGYGL